MPFLLDQQQNNKTTEQQNDRAPGPLRQPTCYGEQPDEVVPTSTDSDHLSPPAALILIEFRLHFGSKNQLALLQ